MKNKRTLADKIAHKGLKQTFLASLIEVTPAALNVYLKNPERRSISTVKAEKLIAFVDAVNSDEKNIQQLAK